MWSLLRAKQFLPQSDRDEPEQRARPAEAPVERVGIGRLRRWGTTTTIRRRRDAMQARNRIASFRVADGALATGSTSSRVPCERRKPREKSHALPLQPRAHSSVPPSRQVNVSLFPRKALHLVQPTWFEAFGRIQVLGRQRKRLMLYCPTGMMFCGPKGAGRAE